MTRHDVHQLVRMMAEDVDFVTVGLTWLRGRADFEKYHARLLTGRFNEITTQFSIQMCDLFGPGLRWFALVGPCKGIAIPTPPRARNALV